MSADKRRVCLGAFAGAHGVTGDIKIKAFTENPENIAVYGPVENEDANATYTLKMLKRLKGDFVLARAAEIKSREDAEALKGQRFFVARNKLPAPGDDEFYLDDLIGLKAVDETGALLGEVGAIHNFGAGDLVELKEIPDVRGVRLVGFTKENVPEVDIKGGVITIRRAAIEADDRGPSQNNDQ